MQNMVKHYQHIGAKYGIKDMKYRQLAQFEAFLIVQLAIIVAILTLAAAMAFPTSAQAEAKKATPAAKTTKIMVYGDSLSAAYGINPKDGWVSLMEVALKNRRVEVVNASISGETSTGGAARIQTDLARHKPDLVLLALGANDGLRGLPVTEMRKNLVTMLDAIRNANAKAIVVGIQIPPNYGLDYANQFKAAFPALARERQLLLVPFLLDGIAESLDYFQADRLHPTAAAQPRILKNVLPVVERALLSQQAHKAGVPAKSPSKAG
jgi:acyl-CoA thioesterase I